MGYRVVVGSNPTGPIPSPARAAIRASRTDAVDTIDSDSGVLDSIKDALGWNDDTHELRSDDVDTDDDGVHRRQS